MRFITFLPMFGKNLHLYLSIIFGSIVATIFTLNFGLDVNVSAQGAPEYLLGNMSLSPNMTAAQAREIEDKIGNYTKTLREKAKGNLTEMNMLLVDDLVKRNIINEKDKQDLVTFISGVNQINRIGNLTIGGKDVSSLIEGLANDNSNPILITLKDTLKKKTGPTPGIPGLPPLTIASEQAWALLGKSAACGLVGGIAYGGGGALMAAVTCSAIL